MGQDVIGEFPVGGDAVILACHADVGFIDQRGFLAGKARVGPGVGLQIVPYLAAPASVLPVLNGAFGVQRQMLAQVIAVAHDGDHLAALFQGIAGQEQFPVAVFQLFEGRIGPVPVVKIPCQVQLIRRRGPFPVHPAVGLIVETVVMVGVGKVRQLPLLADQLAAFAVIPVHAQVDIPLKGLKLRVFFQNAVHEPIPLSIVPS